MSTVARSKYVLFPIENKPIWDLYKQCLAKFWTVDEIDLSVDVKQWNSSPSVLSPGEKRFIKHVLAFFAAADGIVAENLAVHFYGEVDMPEARALYGFQIAMENIHAETYSLLIETFISDSQERATIFNSIETVPCIKAKADWALRWMNSDAPLGLRFVACMAVEGIFFCGSFCSIFWLKKRGLMPGLTFSNELIFWDESQHCATAMLLLLHYSLRVKPTVAEVHAIFAEAVDIETAFMTETLDVALIGMNAAMMHQYIRFVANYWLDRLGFAPLYGAADSRNPFEWMDLMSLQGKTNFFEKRVGEYQKTRTDSVNGRVFTTDEYF